MEKKRKYTFDFHQRWEKILQILRTALFMVVITTINFEVNASAQVAKVSVKMDNATIDEMIKIVRTETNYRFLYRVEEVNKYGKRSINLQDVSIEEFLKVALANTNLSYEIESDVIIIKPTEAKTKENEKSRVIKGKVADDKGFSLPGATIMIKNTTLGVVTDHDGKFKLELPKMDSIILLVSFVGYETQQVAVSNDASKDDKELVIKLKEDITQMEEVVVTGYVNISKESFTGSSVSVKRDELLKVSKTNVIKALQVFDPAFRMVENNQWGSDPNALPEMYIRGRSGIGVKELDTDKLSKSNLKDNPNLPLFIMDGFQVSIQKVYDMDPNRIESMTILKDAAATAMYGSRAANGVVVITTIPPTPGKVHATYTMTGTLNIPDLSDYNLMNAREKLETEVLAGAFIDDEPAKQLDYTQEYYNKLANIKEGVDTYWLSKPLRTVFNHKHSLYLEGGHEDLRFGLNMFYNNGNGVMKESFRDNIGADLSVDYRLNKFQIKNKLTYQQTKSKESPYGSFSEYTKKLPYDRATDEYGNYVKQTERWRGSTWFTDSDLINPLWEAQLGSFDKTDSDELSNETGINWYITPHLLAKATFKMTKTTSHRNNFIDPKSTKNQTPLSMTNLTSGELRTTDEEGTSWDLTANISYNRNIEKNNINFNMGINSQNTNGKTTSAEYRGFPSGQLTSPNYAEDIYSKPLVDQSKTRLVGFVGVLNYSYDNIYLFDASLRLDGSSQFGSEKKWATFWSTGAGINLHNYNFMKNIGWVNLLKVRVSYGLTGKVNFPSYTAQTMYEIQNDEWYKTGYGASLIAFGNENLGWEKKYTTNLGLDFDLFNGAIQFSGDYYFDRTVDLVNDVTIPSSTGFTTYKDNLGEVEGKGFEINLKSTIINTQDWSLNAFFNISHDKRKFTKIAESLKAYNDLVVDHFNDNEADDLSTPFTQYVEGGSLTPIYGMRSLGIDPTNGQELFVKKNGELTYEWSASEQVALGDTEPDAQGSFGFNLRYKNWSLFTTFMYQFGGQEYNTTLVEKVEDADIYRYNADKRVLTDRWQKPGDKAKYRALSSGLFSITQTRPTERFVQNKNVLTCNSLSISYDFNPELLKKLHLGMVRLELGANELFRLSTIKAERGLSYPFARTMDITLHVTF